MKERKSAEQLAAEGHWNGDEVEDAHERLFGRVEQVRTLRGISLADAIALVFDELSAPSWSADADIYRRWRAELTGTKGMVKAISLAEFTVWMETGQFIRGEPVGAIAPSLKLKSPVRQAAFAELMARLDVLVQQQGMSATKAAGSLVNQAAGSTSDAPCELRRLLQEAMGQGGRRSAVVAAVAGLPSIDTMVRWYLRHRSGAVAAIAAEPKRARQWVSRQARWLREAQRLNVAYPGLSDLELHGKLMQNWRDWWGVPVGLRAFRDELKRRSQPT